MAELSRNTDRSTPEAMLLSALRARDAKTRLARARAGLAEADETTEDETRVLLLRQAYLAEINLGDLRQAARTARAMVEVGALRDLALEDEARVCIALGKTDAALGAQRMAARAAPPGRRSFHLFCLATTQELANDTEGAVRSLGRAIRLGGRDRPLLEGYRALLQLRRGRAVRDLAGVLRKLERSPAREGYGRFVLGMLYAEVGARGPASVHLRAFLRRHAAADPAQVLTLREELRRARVALAAIDRDVD